MRCSLVLVYSICISCFLAACHKKQAPPQFDLKDPYRPVMVLTGMPAETVHKHFGLFVIENGKPLTESVALKTEQQRDTLFVQPVFGLGAGMTFEWQVYSAGDTLKTRFTTPDYISNNDVPAAVQAVYPLSDTLPSNILIFHVCFNISMSEDLSAFKKVKLLDADGNEKPFAWREKSVWTDSGRHLVLMVHPGRIKRGIHYAEREGALFEAGHAYTLEIGTELKDHFGRALPKPYRKTFVVSSPDRTSPACKTIVQTLVTNSRNPLTISFNEAMDYGTMLIGCSVADAEGKNIPGVLTPVSDNTWEFVPKLPWQPNDYRLVLNDYVTDLASNHLHRKFEEQQIGAAGQRESLKLAFKVKRAN